VAGGDLVVDRDLDGRLLRRVLLPDEDVKLVHTSTNAKNKRLG
jgi:hypothetical protein